MRAAAPTILNASFEIETATHRITTSIYSSHITGVCTVMQKANEKPSHQHSLITSLNMMFSQVKYFGGKIAPHLDLWVGTN